MKNRKLLAIAVLAIVALTCIFALTACDEDVHICKHKCTTCNKCTDALCTDPVCADKCPVGGDHTSGTEHECQSKCATCGLCTNETCQADACKNKCQLHGADHVCKSKCTTCNKCTNPTCTEPACVDKCQKHGADHVCSSKCTTCNKCTNPTCTEPACTDKCQKHGADHVCKSKCTTCNKCTNPTCTEPACTDKCQKHGADHVCKSKCTTCNKCTNPTCTEPACTDKCLLHGDDHECLSKCDTCHKCTNATCTEPACVDKCQGHGVNHVCKHVCPICESKGNHNACTSDCDEDNCSNKCPGHEYDDLLDYDLTGVTFEDKTVTYNGAPQSLTLTGTLPQGLTVDYEYYKGETKLSAAPEDAGVYKVVAKFTRDEFHKPVADREATLTINKATYDVSGKLADKSVTYNGSAQSVALSEEAPKGITVAYTYYSGTVDEANKLSSAPTNAGTYKVVAKFTVNLDNYTAAVADQTVTLNIRKAEYDMSAVIFEDRNVIYDGTAKTIAIDAAKLPQGVTVSYEYKLNAAVINSAVNAGEYTVTATFAFDKANYNLVIGSNVMSDTKTVTLTIGKATYDMSGVKFEGERVEYDREAHTLTITGTLPEGVSVAYVYPQQEPMIAVGNYEIIARFTIADTANYNAVDDMKATLSIVSREQKIDPDIALGAKTDAFGDGLQRTVEFTKKDSDTFSAYVAEKGNISFTIEAVRSSANVNLRFFTALNEDGTVNTSTETNDALTIENRDQVRYVLVTLANDEDHEYYNDNVILKVVGERRVVTIHNYEELLQLATDVSKYPIGVRLDAKYVLANDIDCGGRVWQTIGTRIPSGSDVVGPYNESFFGELDGQGHKIYNFKLTDESVKKENINWHDGIALGFFGLLTDAKIHDVSFEDITVDFSVVRLADKSVYGDYAYDWVGNGGWNWIYFGAVAGRVNLDDVYFTGNSFENIHVRNLTVNKLSVTESYIGSMFGFDSGIAAAHYGSEVKPTRSNLTVDNVTMVLEENIKFTAGDVGNVRFGGMVGAMFTYQPLRYIDCSISNINVVIQRDMEGTDDPNATCRGSIGGFVAFHYNATWPDDWATKFGDERDGFTKCTLSNYTLVNKSNYAYDYNNLSYASANEGNKASMTFTDCKAQNATGTDNEYGLFRYLYNAATQKLAKYVYTRDPKWTHVCQSVCEICGKCTDENCTECTVKCQKHGDAHECWHVCPICHKCYDATCTEAKCVNNRCPDNHSGGDLLDYDLTNVVYNNEFTYNGQAQALTITSGLPNGVTISCVYFNGETELDGAPTDAGTYKVVVTFTGDKWHKVATKEVVLTINTLEINMDGVTFANKTVDYNGSAHSMAVDGLPAGVEVAYEYYNGDAKLDGAPVNAGTYRVVATFVANANYTKPNDMESTLTISPADIKVTLGATTDGAGTPLSKAVTFLETGENEYTASGLFASYTIEDLNSNDDLVCEFFSDAGLTTASNGKLTAAKQVIYVRVKPTTEQAGNYSQESLTLSVKAGQQGTVELRTYNDLLLMASDVENIPAASRISAVYKLMNDIDCGGAVWQTIGARVARDGGDSVPYGEAFVSEFNGNNHTISNFKITNDSVKAEKMDRTGVAFGFFGFVAVANIHNVNFDSITVDLNMPRTNVIYFGVVAGYVNMDDGPYGNGRRNFFQYINVSNLVANIKVVRGNIGTFFGYDQGVQPGHFNNAYANDCYKKELKGNEINISASILRANDGDYINMGGFVGRMNTYQAVYYVDCSLTNITMVLKTVYTQTGTACPYNGRIGGFAGEHTTIDAGVTTTPDRLQDKFENCSINNYVIENKSYNPNNYTDIHCALDYPENGRKELYINNCTDENADDATKGYGVYWYKLIAETNEVDKYQLVDGTWTKVVE